MPLILALGRQRQAEPDLCEGGQPGVCRNPGQPGLHRLCLQKIKHRSVKIWLIRSVHCRGPRQRRSRFQLKVQVSAQQKGINPLVGQSHLGKATGLQTPECHLFLLCLSMFAAVLFLWCLAWCEWMWGDLHCR